MVFIRQFFARLYSSQFAKNTTILTLGTLAAQMINVASMPVLSRIYSPVAFGLLAVFLAISGIVSTAITLRYETAILLPKSENESLTLVLISAILALLLGISLTVIACVLPESLKSALGISELKNWLVLAILCGLATSFITIATNWYNRKQGYIRMSIIRIMQTSLVAVIAIAMGLCGFTFGLMAGQTVSTFIVAIAVIFNLRLIGLGWRLGWKSDDFSKIFKKYNAAPKYLLPTSLLDVVTLQLPVILITAWFSSEAAGQFSMAWKILALPAAIVGNGIGQVFLQRFSEVWPDSLAARRLLFKTWMVLAMIGLVPMFLVILFGEQLFVWMLGEAWNEAGRMAVILAPMLFVMLVSSPTSGTFLVLGMQRLSLFFGIAVLIYRPICLFWGLIAGDLLFGLVMLVICEITQVLLYQYLVIRRIMRCI